MALRGETGTGFPLAQASLTLQKKDKDSERIGSTEVMQI